MKSLSVTIQMKATEQYFRVVLITKPYRTGQPFWSVKETLKCDHTKESC